MAVLDVEYEKTMYHFLSLSLYLSLLERGLLTTR